MYLLQSIFAKNVSLLIQFILAQGFFVSLGEAWRTPQQAKWNAMQGTKRKKKCYRVMKYILVIALML